MAQKTTLVGIDIAKGKVDVAIRSVAAEAWFADSAEGRRGLLDWLKDRAVYKAVMEASGGYERSWADLLRKAGLEVAIVDPELTLRMPQSLTISTGLDALSHALESIWNRNINPVSIEFAIAAAHEVLATLPAVITDPRNLDLRTRMAQAALFAGLAFSNTKTALAHSISYPITLDYGVPHGIAWSGAGKPGALQRPGRGGSFRGCCDSRRSWRVEGELRAGGRRHLRPHRRLAGHREPAAEPADAGVSEFS